MRFIAGITMAVVLVAVALLSPLGGLTPAQAASISVRILFDLGDGVYVWSPAAIPDPSAGNASWDATTSTAAGLGLSIESQWYACCGVAVTDIGGRDPPAGFAGLFLWNRTARAWQLSPVGISTLVLHDGDAIAWSNAAFDSVDFTQPARLPVPTPDHPDPSEMFRGDALNRGSSESTAPNGASLLWDRDLGAPEIGSTPAVAFGRVFVTTMRGLYALDAETGTVVWTNSRVRGFSSPAAFDGTLVVGGSDGRLYRLNASDGSERWNLSIAESTGFSGITSSPKVAFDRVYVGTLNESGGPGAVVSLWVSNGTVAWRHPTGSVHFSSPAVASGTVYVGVVGRYNTTSGIDFDPPYGVLALNSVDGAERWFFPTAGSVAASPAVAGSSLLVASKDGRVYAVDRGTGTEEWRAAVEAGVSSPAISGDAVYVGGGSFGGAGRVTALNASTGAVVWTFRPNGAVQSSPTVADGKVFFSTNAANGTIYAVAAASGSEVWTYRPEPPQYILGSPVVADGTVFAPSDNGHVYAFRDRPTAGGRDTTILAVLIAVVFVAAVAPIAIVFVMLRRRMRGRA